MYPSAHCRAASHASSRSSNAMGATRRRTNPLTFGIVKRRVRRNSRPHHLTGKAEFVQHFRIVSADAARQESALPMLPRNFVPLQLPDNLATRHRRHEAASRAPRAASVSGTSETAMQSPARSHAAIGRASCDECAPESAGCTIRSRRRRARVNVLAAPGLPTSSCASAISIVLAMQRQVVAARARHGRRARAFHPTADDRDASFREIAPSPWRPRMRCRFASARRAARRVQVPRKIRATRTPAAATIRVSSASCNSSASRTSGQISAAT